MLLHHALWCYDAAMRTTIRLDDELFERLKREAQRQNLSLTRFINRVIEAGLDAPPAPPRRPFKQQVFSMGAPRVPLDKALALADRFEDEQIVGKMQRRK